MNALEKAVVDAAITVYAPEAEAKWCGPEERALERAVLSLLAERQQRERFVPVERVWVARTWADVREGDVVRPPGVESATSLAVKVGPVNHWHAAPGTRAVPLEWASIPVTLRDLAGNGQEFAPANGMNPAAAVEISVTNEELAAIEACGGWAARIKSIENPERT